MRRSRRRTHTLVRRMPARVGAAAIPRRSSIFIDCILLFYDSKEIGAQLDAGVFELAFLLGAQPSCCEGSSHGAGGRVQSLMLEPEQLLHADHTFLHSG